MTKKKWIDVITRTLDGEGNVIAVRKDTVQSLSVRATRTTNQSIPHATYVNVTFPTEDYDDGDLHDLVTNTDRITIPAGGDGLYSIMGGVRFAANNIGSRVVDITVNGTRENDADAVRVQAVDVVSTTTALNVGRQAKLVAGDIVRLRVRQSSGGTLNLKDARIEVAK